MIIIMLGAPGSGKGSVAGVLAEEYNIPPISSGDIFRKNIKEDTELGRIANEYMSKAMLVPDDITINMIISRLKEEDAKDGAILDGFPRTVVQAQAFDKFLEEEHKKIDLVISLEAEENEILTRVINRRVCTNSNCKAVYNLVLLPPKVEGICDDCGSPLYQRDDDTMEKVINRIKVHDTETAPLKDYYAETGVLFSTGLSQKINRMKHEVAKDVIEELSKRYND